MSKRVLTTESAAPVADNRNSASAGVGGPLLLQDQHLLEKPARFNRERIPARVTHARGSGAYGHFEVTDDVTDFTCADFLSSVGGRTEVFVRFPTVADPLGGKDAARDRRGFAVKFCTLEGSCDLAGNNTPVFFSEDPVTLPDFVLLQSRYAKNCERTSYCGPPETGRALSAPLAVSGWTGAPEAAQHTEDDDFFQAGRQYRLTSAGERSRLAANIAGGPGHGRRVEEAVPALREN